MRAAVVDAAGPPEAIHVKEIPVPPLARDHVIIKVDYASVGSWDAKQREGAWGAVKPGTILGTDGSGTVAAVASGIDRLRVGDRVYSFSYQNPDGGFHAQYVSVPAERVEHVPDQLDQRTAGAMPCVAMTAHSGLLTLKAKEGQTLLVYGASGGVGSLGVWLASKSISATVVGTARHDAQEYVRKLGAAHAIDARSSELEAVVKRVAPGGFDVALVTANGDTLAALLAHLKTRAPLAYPNGVEPEPHLDGHRALAFDGSMTREAFRRLNKAIGSKTIPLHIEEFAFDDVVSAHRRIEQGHVIGMIVLRM